VVSSTACASHSNNPALKHFETTIIISKYITYVVSIVYFFFAVINYQLLSLAITRFLIHAGKDAYMTSIFSRKKYDYDYNSKNGSDVDLDRVYEEIWR
jgi:hypothetical protein